MRVRPDVLLFAVLAAGSAFAVWTQLGTDPIAPYEKKGKGIGSVVDDFSLVDISGKTRTLSELRGSKATVLYFWSVGCPCIDVVEPRVQKVMEAYEPKGVAFIGIAGDPDDTKAEIIHKMGRIHAPYRMLLDPGQSVVRAAGVRTSTEVVVLDAQDRIRYRGKLDDDLKKPTTDLLAPALDAVLVGRRPDPEETVSYGCPFPGYEGECEILGIGGAKTEKPPKPPLPSPAGKDGMTR